MTISNLRIIGERIDQGFKSTKKLFDTGDIEAIQELAVKQKDAGAACLNLNVGQRARDDPQFMREIIKGVQAVVDIPLAFDFPNVEVQENCLATYDQEKAGGNKPLINSIAETRQEMIELLKIRPCKVIVMISEALQDGTTRQVKTAQDKHTVTKRMVNKLLHADSDLSLDDLIIDVAINTLSSDTEGLTRNTIECVKLIRSDPDLKGIHMSGGLSNLTAQLPEREIGGQQMKLQLESAFLTHVVSNGFDYVLSTPWKDFQILHEDNPVFQAFKEVIELTGFDALRRLRKLYM